MHQTNKLFAILLSLSLIMLPLGAANSAMIGSSQLIDPQQGVDRATLLQSLDRQQVRDYLSQQGVDADQVKLRVVQMTDDEIATLNSHLADLPAGGDILGVILVIFVVFIVTDMLGATDVFPFVHPIR
jgi:hypothetical protein